MKLIMLNAFMAKLDASSKEAFIGELTSLIKLKTGGLDFSVSENDITKTLTEDEPEQSDEEKETARVDKFTEASKKFADSGPGSNYGGINVQEM
jgi:hypothetical protein